MRSRSLLWSFNYAIEGIVYAFRTQRNMRVHFIAATIVLIGALFFNISRLEMIALIFSIAFVIIAELLNTAVEATVDIVTDRFEPLAKTAKDVAAGSVLVASITAAVTGYIVFYGRLAGASDVLFARVRSTPLHITIIALAVTLVAVIVGKAMTREGTYMSGGWPSGHTAVAVATATALGYVTMSPFVFLGALFIAALVAQSRVEGNIHSIPQTIVGALLGFLIATAVFQMTQAMIAR